MSPAVLEGVMLHKAFGLTQALRGASLAVAPGEVVAVSGPSGSGKSTLLHVLAGIVTPDGGEVRFEGAPLGALSEAARAQLRRQRFGIVFQFGQLVAEFTACQNVALPLMLGGRGRREAERLARDWLARAGVLECADLVPGQCSGGQRQRVAVARALVTQPAVVLADEPTGALDSLGSEQLLDMLLDAVGQTGAGLVLITHDNRVAARADREVVLRDGVERRDTPPGSPPRGPAQRSESGAARSLGVTR